VHAVLEVCSPRAKGPGDVVDVQEERWRGGISAVGAWDQGVFSVGVAAGHLGAAFPLPWRFLACTYRLKEQRWSGKERAAFKMAVVKVKGGSSSSNCNFEGYTGGSE